MSGRIEARRLESVQQHQHRVYESVPITSREVPEDTDTSSQLSSRGLSPGDASEDDPPTRRRGCGKGFWVCIAVWLVFLAMAPVMLQFGANYGARRGVIVGMSYLFGYAADLDSADVSVWSGETRLTGLTVSNPPGFEGDLLQLREGLVDANPSAFFSNPIWIRILEMNGLLLSIENNGTFTNARIVIQNFENITYVPPWLVDKRVVLQHLRITDITVRCNGFLLQTQGMDLTPEDIIIDDVGGQDGVLLTDLVGNIMRRLVHSSLTHAPEEMRNAVGAGLHAGVSALEHVADVFHDQVTGAVTGAVHELEAVVVHHS